MKIKINDKEYNYPESFDDITMKDYCNAFFKLIPTDKDMSDDEIRIVTLRNESIIISRLLGEKDDFVQKLPLSVFGILREKSAWIYNITQLLETNEFVMEIDGDKYMMPKPEEMSLRQYIDADMTMKEADNKQQFIELLSILLLPVGKDGKFRYDGNYKDIMPKIENMKASKGLPFVYTFFKKKETSKRLMREFSAVAGEDQHAQNTKSS